LDSASKKFQDIGKTISDAGSTLTKAVTLPVAGLGTAIIKTGADYEAGMSKVQAISGATASDMEKLEDEAMRMAAQTKFSTAESAEAYQYMAMAGWDASQMADGLSGIMLLASASGEDLASTSDIVTDALTAFGLQAKDSGHFADVLAAASNSANTNVSMLGESFKYVAPVAGAMGYSAEDTSIALGLMANSGIKASQAGTALRTTLTNMTKPTADMEEAMYLLGVSLDDEEGNMYSLMEVMEQLRAGFAGGTISLEDYNFHAEQYGKLLESGAMDADEYALAMEALDIALNGTTAAQQAELAAMLAGKEGMSGLLAIVNAAPEDFDKLTESIYGSKGTTEKMADIMNDNAAGAMAMLSSAINVLLTNLSKFLIPAFTEIVRKVTEVVNWFNSLDAGTQKLILTIAGVAAAAGPVLTVIGKIVTTVGTIGSAIGGLIGTVQNVGSAVSGLFAVLAANPIAAVIAAVAALVAGLVVLWNTNEGFRDAVGAIWEAITGFFTGAVDTIKAAWGEMAKFFSSIWESIQSAFEGVVEFFGGIFAAAAELVQAAWSAVVDFFSGVWESIQGVFSIAAEVLGGFFSAAWETVRGVWEAATGFFSGIADGIHSVFETVTQFLGEAFQAAWDAVQSAWSAAVDFFNGIWEAIKNAAGTAAEFVGNALKKAWDAIQKVWSGAIEFFSGIAGKIVGAFSGIGGKFLEIGSNIVNGLKNGVSGAWTNFTSFISNKVGGIVSAVKKMLGIHSPSTVFAGIGENMALGLSEGWADQYNSVKSQIERGMDFGAANISQAYSGTSNQRPASVHTTGNDFLETAQPIKIVLQAVLNEKVIGEASYQYMINRQRAYGGQW